jgi:hypothetical protein
MPHVAARGLERIAGIGKPLAYCTPAELTVWEIGAVCDLSIRGESDKCQCD